MKPKTPIAIVGMGCLFPKSPGLKAYWRLLYHGVDAIIDIPETHWSPIDYFDDDPEKPDHVYCKRGGFLPQISFDPTEFGIPPSSLEAIDTSQILGLVVAKDALEDAGYGKDRAFNREKTSVILGVTGTQELVIPLGSRLGHPKWRKALNESGISQEKTEEVIERISDAYVPWQENSFPGLLGNVVAGRICNRLDLGGTNCVVDAACASSMSAIHLALLELESGRSDMVISGGVDTINDIFMHMCFSKTHTLSRTGDARPFSKHADGTVLGEGIGMVVLKRLRDAENDGDRIYAVIKAVGSSSDGKSQSIYAPRKEGQIKALRHAYTNASTDPASVELVETHGTGTRVGDAVEFQALNRFFGERTKSTNRCAIGSVKSNIGHTKAAAGAAGLIKSALALYNKVLPPTLKADEPDPDLRIHETPFYLCTETRPWFLSKEHPRRAGVSAFGFGGSNFHAVLEEHHPKKQDICWDGSVEILALSSSTRNELLKHLRSTSNRVQKDYSPENVSKTAAQTRQDFSFSDPYRLLLVLEQPMDRHPDTDGRITRLFDAAVKAVESDRSNYTLPAKDIFYGGPEKPGAVAFLFPGQGSQYVGMCRDLICSFPSAFDILEKSNNHFTSPAPLSDLIFPPPARNKDEKILQEKALRQTDVAQPALGAVSLALMKILNEFNVKPDATAGHSYGELTALCAAGWFDADNLIRVSMSRGKFMAASGRNSAQGNGAMLAVKAPLDGIAGVVDHIGPDIVLANRNAPDQGVLSGPTEAIAQAEDMCKQKGFRTVKLPVSAAFHSSLVRDAQKPFTASLHGVAFSPSRIPVYANTTGKPYPADVHAAKQLLGEQILHSVNFVKQIENMFASGIRSFVEIGPKSILTGLVKSILENRDFQAIALDSASGKRSGMADLARALCCLAARGHPVELTVWEPPAPVKRKQMMQIPIGGANYRNPEPETRKKEKSNITHEPVNKTMNREPKTKHQPAAVADALKVLQEGLRSMQALQTQTAEAHKKFLETQTEAGRTLQSMMENTQRLAQSSPGPRSGLPVADVGVPGDVLRTAAAPGASIPEDADNNQTPHASDTSGKTPGDLPDPAAPSALVTAETPSDEPHRVPTDRDVQPAGSAQEEIAEHMLAVVSRLTGYPAEMLGLDMDIEADLGIDSIKRVEILSALEEKIPDLPPVSPEHVGKLKTLGQIAEYLSAGSEPPLAAPLPEQQSPSSTIGRETIEISMLAVVSRLTGYPAEMLGLDMDIEADLGIDSIKRVEILSALEEKIPDLPPVSPEHVGKLKTLGQIAEYLSAGSTSDEQKTSPVPGENSAEKSTDAPSDEKRPHSADRPTSNIRRSIVTIVNAPLNVSKGITIPDSRKVYITDDTSGLSESIADEFARLNTDAVLLSDALFSDVVNNRERLKDAAGLIIVPEIRSLDDRFLKDAFLLAKQTAPHLLDAAAEGAALFAAVTRLDGAFGFRGREIVNPLQGGLAGLVKTASLEWNAVRCRALDIAPDWKENKEIAQTVVAELLHTDPSGPVEIGLGRNQRWTLALERTPYPDGRVRLDPGDVVVVTGGARGITARAALALAEEAKPTLVLMGRSPEPVPEPEWLAACRNEADIKKAILENEFSGRDATPVQVEKSFKKQMANREIIQNLEQMRAVAENVLYCSVDIRDADNVSAVLESIRTAHGPITGIVHGAGVLEDRTIADKTITQFENVFDPKVKGLVGLLEATKQDALKYLVLFSSVTARIGNNGQVDYAMANEVLNKIAQQEANRRPDCKVVSINWGPWDGGMVCSALKRKFERNNIALIPVEAGARAMIDEMRGENNLPVEVVIGASVHSKKEKEQSGATVYDFKSRTVSTKKETLSLTLKRDIDIDRYPILRAHILDGKPVVPFALIAEWLGHGALHENPGLFLHGLDDMRVLKGIKLDSEKKTIRLMAGKARKNGANYEVDVEIRDGIHHDVEMIHSRATAVLTDEIVQPPIFNRNNTPDAKAYARSIDEVYEKILFHGTELRGIKEILNCSPRGMTARVAPAPAPITWMREPLRSRWISDPLVLDSAFQMAIVWCFEEMGMVSLPSYSASYRQYRSNFPANGVTAVLEVKQVTDHKMAGDFVFLDDDDGVVATLTGYEAIMDDSLHRAFQTDNR